MRILLLLLAASFVTPCVALAKECTREEAMAAEDIAARLTNWKQIFGAFEHYSHCDDGAIAEGFTDSVVRLLASHWQTLPQVSALERKNPSFRAFVLRHINASADNADLNRVATLARTQCPKGYSSFCSAIAKAASKK